MLGRLFRYLTGRKKACYTQQQISDGLDILVLKIAKISLSVEILSPYLKGEKINGKNFVINAETMPLVIILQDAIRYHYGQLGRSYFDTQGRHKNTSSITVLYNQIFYAHKGSEQVRKKYKSQYEDINRKLGFSQKYKKKLNQYCNKHFAHSDSKSPEKAEQELVKLSIPWNEFVTLINNAKSILANMCLTCQKEVPDYSEHVYKSYREQFWKLIEFTEVKISNHQ